MIYVSPAYLAFFGLVPLPPIEDADSAYVVFMELLNQPVPPQDVTIIMGGWREVEPLRDESSIADGREWSTPNSSCDVKESVAYKTTAFPCSSLNRSGTLLNT